MAFEHLVKPLVHVLLADLQLHRTNRDLVVFRQLELRCNIQDDLKREPVIRRQIHLVDTDNGHRLERLLLEHLLVGIRQQLVLRLLDDFLAETRLDQRDRGLARAEPWNFRLLAEVLNHTIIFRTHVRRRHRYINRQPAAAGLVNLDIHDHSLRFLDTKS